MGVAMGKWQDLTGLVIDHVCDNPQNPQSQYPIPFVFREELCAVVWLSWKGCVQGDSSLDTECDNIFVGTATAVVTPPNYVLHNSQGCKVWVCEYESSRSEGSYSGPQPQHRFLLVHVGLWN